MSRELDKNICTECESEYFTKSSKMSNLCPDCAHRLYGYDNCYHEFENGRCKKCHWNGKTSEYLEKKAKRK